MTWDETLQRWLLQWELDEALRDEQAAMTFAAIGFALIVLVLTVAFCALSVWAGPQ